MVGLHLHFAMPVLLRMEMTSCVKFPRILVTVIHFKDRNPISKIMYWSSLGVWPESKAFVNTSQYPVESSLFVLISAESLERILDALGKILSSILRNLSRPLFISMSLVEGALLKNLTINSLVGFPFSIALRNLPLTGFCPSNLDVSFNTILWRFCLCKTLLWSGMTWFLTWASFNLPSVTRSIFFLQILPYFPS